MPIIPSERNELEWANPTNWHWFNAIYVSRQDDRVFVPRRPSRRGVRKASRVATTPNFGNWRAYPPVLLTVAVMLLIETLADYLVR